MHIVLTLSCSTEVLVPLLSPRKLVLRGLFVLIRNSHCLVQVRLEVGRVNAWADCLFDNEAASVGSVVFSNGSGGQLDSGSS